MSKKNDQTDTQVTAIEQDRSDSFSLIRADNAKLAELGYKAEFRREFSVRVPFFQRTARVKHSAAIRDRRFCFLNYGGDSFCYIDLVLRPHQWFDRLLFVCCMMLRISN
jgi:hypothetical protein